MAKHGSSVPSSCPRSLAKFSELIHEALWGAKWTGEPKASPPVRRHRREECRCWPFPTRAAPRGWIEKRGTITRPLPRTQPLAKSREMIHETASVAEWVAEDGSSCFEAYPLRPRESRITCVYSPGRRAAPSLVNPFTNPCRLPDR